MGSYRSRSYSPRRVSRSPPRRKRYDIPRDRYRGGDRGYRRPAAPTGLLVRNIALGARPDDLRIPFERFGPVKDVYLPKNYHTGEPRGFGFVKFRYAEDAAIAKQQMNRQVIGGREISIVFAEENRKTPQEMYTKGRPSDRYVDRNHRRRSPSISPRRRYHSYSRSASPPRHDSRERRDKYDDCSPPPRSISPPRERRKPKSSHRSPSPEGNGRGSSPADGHRRRQQYSTDSYSRGPSRSHSFSPR